MLLLRARTRRRALRCIALLTLTLICAGQAATQTASAEDEVFAPFVSRLRLSIRDPQVRITWEDAGPVITDYRVYRSNEPITNETLGEAALVATVTAGDKAYIDVPPAPGSYHYAVLAESPSGAPYRAVIPGRNASYRAVTIANIASPVERAAQVERIDATVVDAEGTSAVEVTAVADREARRIAVYRSTEPIVSVQDLADASLVSETGSDAVRLLDLPVPGVPYYYAAVDSALLLAGGAEIRPGANATLEPVEIPLRAASLPAARGSAREANVSIQPTPDRVAGRGVPLPFLQLQSRLSTGRSLHDPRIHVPDEQAIDLETAAAIRALLERVAPGRQPPASVTLLAVDRIPAPEGAEYTLRTILDGPVRRMAWEEALGQLANYLLLPLTGELEARAHFYRAQVFYFLGERQRAILEFLLARDQFYVESEEWLDRILGERGA